MDRNYYYNNDEDEDDDRDHPLQEPEFVIHIVDDDRRRRAPAPHPPPVQPPPPHEPDDDQQNAARIECLRNYMVFPQIVLTGWSMLLGCTMIVFAARPDMRPDPHFIWVMVMVGFIMLFMLVSTLLSYLGVYVYVHDRYPRLNDCFHS